MTVSSHQSAQSAARLFQRAARLRRQCRHYASTSDLAQAKNPQPGYQAHGFTLNRVKEVRDLQLTALHFRHDKTGAQYLHLLKDDKNNVFSIGFKTNPPDRTGVPHILEHLTLCGSQKYPVRDPFFKMMPRSLNNFMNAMTYPDHTVYPFATTNPPDFLNLTSVYLDSTLHPLLREHDFLQEGWRIGPQDPYTPTSPDNPLLFKGVVYNEMKGNMSNADYLFRTRWQDNFFPSLNDSGGDPQKMTDLTYQQICQFQSDHYIPSNALVMTYGNIPFPYHLQNLNKAFDKFNFSFVDEELKVPISLDEGPQEVKVFGPMDPLYQKDQQLKASVSWIMGDTSDVFESFSLGVISSLLLDGYSAPIYQNTIDIGWGAAYTPNTGYDSSAKRGTFTIGVSGIKRQDLSRLNDGLRNTLEAVKRQGFSRVKVEGRLRQIELELKNKTASFGMGLTSRLQDGWFNGTDPLNAVDPEEVIPAMRAKTEQPDYLMELFERYWLTENTFTFVMEPSETFGEEMQAEEAARLSEKIAGVSSQYPSPEKATASIVEKELQLVKAQEKGGDEDLSCLPTLHVRDIPRKAERKTLRFSKAECAHVQWRETPTNGLTYFRAIQPLDNLPDELRIYLPLFSTAIQRLGTKTLSIERLEDSIRILTGGISMSHHASTSPLDINASSEGLVFGGTALDESVPHMYELIRNTIQDTDFNRRDAEEKISELIKAAANTALNDVADSGHAYACRFAESGISPQARMNEQTDGMTQVRLMMDLASHSARFGMGDVLDKLMAIQKFVLHGGGVHLRVALTCGPEAATHNEKTLESFLAHLYKAKTKPAPSSPNQVPYPRDAKIYFPLPYQVYYGAHATRTVPYTHPDSPALSVLAQLLTHKRMHPEIREKGGAYGAGAYQSALKGIFGFYSYRDPNPQNSLRVMDEAGAWAADRQWTEREIEEAKLSVFQSVDAPESVSEEGMGLFLSGVDHEMEQTRRERLLDVSAAQVRDVAGKYVVEGKQGEMNTAVLGEKREWMSEEDGWTEMPMEGKGRANEDESEEGYLVI